MHFPLTVFLSVLLLDLPFIFTQTSPTSVKPNTAPGSKCPVLNTSPHGSDLHVELLPNKQCYMVVSVTSQRAAFDRLVSLLPRVVTKEMRNVYFLETSFRRSPTPQMSGIRPVNCPRYNVVKRGNTIIIETRAMDCYVTIAHREMLALVMNPVLRRPILVRSPSHTKVRVEEGNQKVAESNPLTSKQSYEVNTAGPFLSNPGGLPIVPRPGATSTSRPGVQSGIPGFGRTIPPAPGVPSNPLTGVRAFMPQLVFPQALGQISQNVGSQTAGGAPPPVPASLTTTAASGQ